MRVASVIPLRWLLISLESLDMINLNEKGFSRINTPVQTSVAERRDVSKSKSSF